MLAGLLSRHVLLRPSFRLSFQALHHANSFTAGHVLRQAARNITSRSTVSKPASAVPPIKAAPKRHAYPERLLIYHAGTGRTVFVGCLKITTVFIFAFFSLIVAPAHYYAPDEPKWVPFLILASGAVPLAFVTVASRPFVNFVHLHLPPYARQSREFVHRYSMGLPPTATLDITTMNLVGKQRITRMKVSELRPMRAKAIGGANYARDLPQNKLKKAWYEGKSIREFAIGGGEGNSREKGVWENVRKVLNRRRL